MRSVSFYDAKTGLFNGSNLLASDDQLVELNTPSGHTAIDGHYDSLSQCVDIATGQVIDYQPPQPSADYEWSADTKRWVLSAAAQSKIDNHNAAAGVIASGESRSLRALREFALGMPGAQARLQAIDDEISSSRPQL